MIVAIDLTNRVHVLWHVRKETDGVLQAIRDDIAAISKMRGVERIVAAFDAPGPTFRHRLHVGYKADRKPRDPGLIDSLLDARAVCQIAGATVIEAAGYEADDVLASVAAEACLRGRRCTLATLDKDVRQCLVEGRTNILRGWTRDRGLIVKPNWITAGSHTAEYGFAPGRWIDYQCIVGDNTDTICGWPSVGDVTARRWLASASLDELLADPERLDATKLQRASMADFVRRLPVVRQLVALRTDVPLPPEICG